MLPALYLPMTLKVGFQASQKSGSAALRDDSMKKASALEHRPDIAEK
jgi:hypothetical protein